MPQPKITLYVDIVSPFGYMAFYVLKHSPVFKHVEITYVPILLGGLMNKCGNVPPLNIKNKDKWIDNERTRWSKQLNIPMSKTTPPGFPINTLSIQRALVSLSISHPQSLENAVALFWEHTWAQWKEPNKPENILAIISTIVGSDEEAQKVLERSKGAEVKKTLSANTDQAFDDGAFGLPWFVATNTKGEKETFWGVDRLGQLCDHLDLERPVSKGWRALL